MIDPLLSHSEADVHLGSTWTRLQSQRWGSEVCTLITDSHTRRETAAQTKLDIRAQIKRFLQYRDSFNMSLEDEKATREAEIEAPTLRDIKFPEIPRRLAALLPRWFYYIIFSALCTQESFCAEDSESSSAPRCVTTLPPAGRTETSSASRWALLLPVAQIWPEPEPGPMLSRTALLSVNIRGKKEWRWRVNRLTWSCSTVSLIYFSLYCNVYLYYPVCLYWYYIPICILYLLYCSFSRNIHTEIQSAVLQSVQKVSNKTSSTFNVLMY